MKGIFLGIDAGGSHTRAAISGPAGVVGAGHAGPGNWTSMEPAGCIEALTAATGQALRSANLKVVDLTHACVSLAGYYPPWHAAKAREGVAQALPGLSFHLVPDLIAAWAGATGDSAGVVLAAGTGAVAYGRDARGREARAGGWGHLFGDEGGGFWIGREVLRAASRSVDGRGPATTLVEAVRPSGIDPACHGSEAHGHHLQSPGCDEAALRAVYRDDWTRERIAGLTVAAARHAEAGDPVAREILERAAAELGSLIEAVIRRLDGYAFPLPLSAVGGVLDAGPALLGPLRRWVTAVLPHLEWKEPLGSPLEGALWLAQRQEAG